MRAPLAGVPIPNVANFAGQHSVPTFGIDKNCQTSMNSGAALVGNPKFSTIVAHSHGMSDSGSSTGLCLDHESAFPLPHCLSEKTKVRLSPSLASPYHELFVFHELTSHPEGCPPRVARMRAPIDRLSVAVSEGGPHYNNRFVIASTSGHAAISAANGRRPPRPARQVPRPQDSAADQHRTPKTIARRPRTLNPVPRCRAPACFAVSAFDVPCSRLPIGHRRKDRGKWKRPPPSFGSRREARPDMGPEGLFCFFSARSRFHTAVLSRLR